MLTLVHPFTSSHPGGILALDSETSDKSASSFYQKRGNYASLCLMHVHACLGDTLVCINLEQLMVVFEIIPEYPFPHVSLSCSSLS